MSHRAFIRFLVIGAAGMWISGAVATAQPTRLIPSGPADSMRCWWRTSTSAVRVGEVIRVVLTCSVLETDTVRVVPDESRLDPTAFQLPPFEVVSGIHPPDLRARDRRFFQYEYRVRLIDDQVIGRDVPLPQVRIGYRVENRAESGAAVQGIEQVYAMPAHSIRIVSIVPQDATDIRAVPAGTFADVDARAFRARTMTTVGGVLFGLAGLSAVMVGFSVFERYRAKKPAKAHLVVDAAVLRRVGRELDDVARESTITGWTRDLAGRALMLFRIAAGYATGQPASQRLVEAAGSGSTGALMMAARRRSRGARQRVSVSAALTPQGVAQRLSRNEGSPQVDADRAAQLQTVLAEFTRARYGRTDALDQEALNQAMATGRQIVSRLAFEQTWFTRTLSSVSERLRRIGQWR
jgi:hypothetical protein